MSKIIYFNARRCCAYLADIIKQYVSARNGWSDAFFTRDRQPVAFFVRKVSKNNTSRQRIGRFLLSSTCMLLLFFGTAMAQEQAIHGRVSDSKGEPVEGATVTTVSGSTAGTSTDAKGDFSLTVADTVRYLTVSFLGASQQVGPIEKGKPIEVVLNKADEQLDEVVVVGYQTMKRKDLTGSVASVSGKDIAAIPVANVAQAIQGKLPGVNVSSQDGRPNADVAIRVRGGGSISQSNQPLVLVDGVIVGSLNDVPGDMVESIDVLKDASSTAIYGARGQMVSSL